MTTDYDPIAEQYQRSKQQPWRTFIECFTLMDLVGDPTGLSVLDLACGEGFYTRLIRHRGAAGVRGLDLSEGMIALAQAQEARQPLGVTYAVADARELSDEDPVDLSGAGRRVRRSSGPSISPTAPSRSRTITSAWPLTRRPSSGQAFPRCAGTARRYPPKRWWATTPTTGRRSWIARRWR